MDYKQGTGRPSETGGSHKQPSGSKQKSIKKAITIAVVSFVLVVALALATVALLAKTNETNPNAKINKDDYQAVFLANGQVYFGKLQNSKGDYLELTNIYYLQVDSAVQQAGGASSANNAAAAANSESNVQLIKLGNELHGPRDAMQLNNDQVLFWENLKPDSKVSEAIKNYKQ